MLPFSRVPRIVLIHLIKNAVFWLNSFPARDGVSSEHSPRFILTGQELSYKLHVRLEFGSYVQTHEEHNNSMNQRSVGAICLGPTGNAQGGHHFMSLSTGQRITRHRWTELPMPKEVIIRVSELGQAQNMPETLTFADRLGMEIEDGLDDLDQETSDSIYIHNDEYESSDSASYNTDDHSINTHDEPDDFSEASDDHEPDEPEDQSQGSVESEDNEGVNDLEHDEKDDASLHDESGSQQQSDFSSMEMSSITDNDEHTVTDESNSMGSRKTGADDESAEELDANEDESYYPDDDDSTGSQSSDELELDELPTEEQVFKAAQEQGALSAESGNP